MLPEIQELTDNINAMVGSQRLMSQAILSAEVKQLHDRIERAVLLFKEAEMRFARIEKKVAELESEIKRKG
jgi:NifU-like protein involved in Fe-S cluster formation